MKKIISLCLITFLCTNLYAQESIEVEPTEKSVEAVKLTNPVNPSKITLYAEPFWFIIRKLSLDLQFQVGKKITVGPLLSYRSDDATFSSGFILIGDQKIKEREFGVRSNFYFAGAHKHSAYLGLSLVRSEVDITRFTDFFTGASGSASYSLNKLTLLGGFRWKWGRVSLGVGGGLSQTVGSPDRVDVEYADGTRDVERLDVDEDFFPYLFDLQLGFNF